ncbi:rCG24580 [Rattus norvegicus]|uniref:RCG24580 n=1 Tax=Rattus norvegicus TaxID=10116 RepID=A6JC76_RAT|nr:rCG24580 [Rattus norvegicus]
MLCLCSPSFPSLLPFILGTPHLPGDLALLLSLFFSPFSSIQFLISFAFLKKKKSFFPLLNNASVFRGWEKLEKWFCEVPPLLSCVHRPPSADPGVC